MTNRECILATIATRFSELNSASKQAKLSLQEVRFKLFTDFVSKEEELILTKALKIVEQIEENTNQNDAVQYFIKDYTEKTID